MTSKMPARNAKSTARALPIAATFLAMTVISSGDLIEIIPVFAPFVAGPLFPFAHEPHDILAVMLALYVAHKLTPAVGTRAMLWYLALHLPYAYLTFPAALPELVRIALIGAAAFFGIYIISLRKRAEDRLRLQATALDAAANAVFITDRQGIIEWVNPAFSQITGYTLEEAVGRTPRILKSGQYTRAFYKTLWDTILAGEVWQAEMVNRRPDGGLFTVQQTITPLRNAQGEITHFIAIQQDITERKQAEAALRESEDRYRDLVENSQDLICTHDLNGQILSFNPSAEKMLGYPVETLKQMNIRDIIVPSARPVFETYIAILKRRGKAHGIMHIQTGNGEQRFWEYNNTLRTEGVSVPIVRGMARDVTERQQAEKALRASEKRFRALIENGRDQITLLAADGALLWESPSAVSILGYAPNQFVGRNIFELMHPDDQAWTRNMYAQVVQTAGSIQEGVFRLLHADGSWRWIEATATNLLDEPSVQAIVINYRDITERKRAEEELYQSEEKYRFLFEHNPHPMWAYDLKTLAFLAVNDSAVEKYGHTREEFLRMTIADIRPVEDVPRLMEDLAQQRPALQHAGEWRHRLKDGTIIDVEITSHTLRMGEHNASLVVAQDITERKRAEEEIHRRADEFTSLYETSRDINSQQDLQMLLIAIVERATKLLSAPRGLCYLYDAATDELELVVEHGSLLPIGARLKMDEGAAGVVMRTREPFIVDNYTVWEGRAAQYKGIEIAAVLEVPMLYHGEMIGVLGVSEVGSSTRQFFDADAHLLSLFASSAAGAVHNTRLLEETARQLSRMEALHHIDLAISASMDLRVTLDIILKHVTTQLKVDAADVLLFNPHMQMLEYAAGCGFRSRAVERTRFRIGEGQAGLAALERRLIQHPDFAASGNTFAQAELLAAENVAAYFALPLISKGEVKGVLEVFHRSVFHPGLEWINFLETLAGQAAIAIDSAQLFENLQISNTDLINAYDRTIEGWSNALDLRDEETEGHSQRVTALTLKLARASGMTEAELVHVRRGALLHDIGKMGVPDHILLKPDKLTDEEWVAMRKHPTFAHELLLPIAYLRPALDIPYCHHEKWDGTGYPRGLKGEQIPLAARLFAIVDVWDALRSDRPYRQGWPNEKAINHIKSLSGTHFDPKAVDLFLNMVPELSKDQAE
ncbi:MAG: PAS domain S-box protein [Anaerolineales bacterium]|nr:PAS domain S-box protein [Anaerolineales bacterium]